MTISTHAVPSFPLITWFPNPITSEVEERHRFTFNKHESLGEIVDALAQYIADTSSGGYVTVTYPKPKAAKP